MTSAARSIPTSPAHCLDGYLALIGRLGRVGVTVAQSQLSGGRAATYHHLSATLHLHDELPLSRQLAVLVDFWMRLVIGPEASRAIVRRHRLELVR